jgi:imidazoleglycerol phosphate dehydratase HisB
MTRTAEITRNTSETQIRVALNLDGTGRQKLNTGVPFLDHMLDQIARHGLIDLEVEAVGDLHIDAHHTVEDTGITLGMAVARAIGDHAGVTLHIDNLRGVNAHHQCETVFKAFGRALRMAAELDERAAGTIPSTKGSL